PPPTRPIAARTKRPGVSTWIVGGIAALLCLIYGITGGVGAVLIVLSLFVFPTALVAMASHRRTWMRLPTGKRLSKFLAFAAAVAFVLGCVVVGSAHPSTGQVTAN